MDRDWLQLLVMRESLSRISLARPTVGEFRDLDEKYIRLYLLPSIVFENNSAYPYTQRLIFQSTSLTHTDTMKFAIFGMILAASGVLAAPTEVQDLEP